MGHAHRLTSGAIAMARKNLAAALKGESGKAERNPSEADPTVAPKKNSPMATGVIPTYVPPSRKGKKVISGYFAPEVSKQLKLLCIEEDNNVQGLLQEALNDLFTKYSKSPIA